MTDGLCVVALIGIGFLQGRQGARPMADRLIRPRLILVEFVPRGDSKGKGLARTELSP